MENDRRPLVRPKEEIWEECLKLAEKYNMTPFKVLERFVEIGAVTSKVEEAGGTAFLIKEGASTELKVFEKNGKTSQKS